MDIFSSVILILTIVLIWGLHMSAIDNLTEAVSKLPEATAKAVAKIIELKNTSNDAAIQDAADKINSAVTSLNEASA